jgi:acyl-CoA synthetase (AMP-forming)/AMP-acid ligase II/acyl carrier protein
MGHFSEPRTFVHAFLRHVETSPDQTAIRYLHEGEIGGPTTSWSYAELGRRARVIAASLAHANVRPGDRALLYFEECLGFCETFMGCLLAGVVPVPVASCESGNLERALARLGKIAPVSGSRVILTAPSSAVRVGRLVAEASLVVLPVCGDGALDAGWEMPVWEARDVAFLQFTSGSTSDPKGVIVTHANLCANQRILSYGMGVGAGSNIVSWLPVHHDMGLVAGLLLALWHGRGITSMLPRHFMERPARWLEAISGQEAVTSGAPNFAFALVIRKLSDEVVAGLDLSGWATAYCGAEPIRREVIRRFVERLAPCGLRPQAMFPCYGLAEATVYGTGCRPWTKLLSPSANDGSVLDGFVVCGEPGQGMELAIVDPVRRTRCGEGAEGEVWLRGPNVAQGYWGDAEQTARTFAATIEGEDGTWLRTGDLGRVRAGALYVTGRIKDLIVVNGRNVYPQDVELVIDECHAEVRPGCAAAFGLTGDGSEAVGVAFELRSPEAASQAIVDAARVAVARALDVQLGLVALLAPRTLPKTTSGKQERQATRVAIEDGSLVPLLLWRAPLADTIAALAGWICAYCGRAIDSNVDGAGLDELGLDSIGKAELLEFIHGNFGRRLTMEQLLAQTTLADVAALILRDPVSQCRPTGSRPVGAAAPFTAVLPSLSWLQAK